jgi:ribose transport system substrate-binding protein
VTAAKEASTRTSTDPRGAICHENPAPRTKNGGDHGRPGLPAGRDRLQFERHVRDGRHGGHRRRASAGSGRPAIKNVTYVNPLPSYPDFNVVGQCFKAQAAKYGWQASEVGITGTTVNNQESIDQISQAIADGSSALLVFPTVDQMFAPVMKQARSKGIYVVALNTGDPSTGQQTEVGSDDAQMGKLMADGLGAKDPGAVVGFLSLSASTQAHAQIIAGFKAEAAAKFPKMTFPVSAYDNGAATQDVDIFNNMIAAHPNLTAIFPVEGAAIPAAITAVREAGKTGKISVVGFDLTAITRAEIEAGTLYGVVDQGWCDMGTQAAIAMKNLSEGKSVPPFIPTSITFITKQNLPHQ